MTNAAVPRRRAQQQQQAPADTDVSATVQFGPNDSTGITFHAYYVPQAAAPNVYPAVRASGAETSRAARDGIVPFLIDTLQGGFSPESRIGSYGRDKTGYRYNDGVYGTWMPGVASKAYKPTINASLVSADFSTFTSSNLRVHAVLWPTSSGLRNIFGIGTRIFKDASVTDPTVTAPATADNVTNNILAMWLGINSSGNLALYIGTDGQTDDIKYTEDPTADSITWVSAVTYSNAADRTWWGYYSKTMRRHVVAGILNNEELIYAFKDSDTEPLTSSTVQPVPWADTKDQKGDIASVTTSAQGVTVGSAEYDSASTTVAGSSVRAQWNNPGNLTASDDTYVTLTVADDALGLTDMLLGSGCDFSSVPLAAKILGYKVEIECKESNADDNCFWGVVKLLIGGSVTGVNHGDGSELPTTEAYVPFGGSADAWGLDLTGKDIQNMGGVMQLYFDGSNTTPVPSIDHMRVTLTYQFPGYKTHVSQGSYGWGEDPDNADDFLAVEPESDDATAIKVRRKLARYTFTLDGANDRVLLSKRQYVNTGLPYVGGGNFFQGGPVAFGGPNSATFDHVVTVNTSGQALDVKFPRLNGTTQQYVCKVVPKGAFLLEEMVPTDFSDAQIIGYYGGLSQAAHFGVGAAQSLTGSAIAKQPLLWAETEAQLNTEQNVIYRFYPVSTTALAVEYEFIPSNMFDDPHLFNTTQVKIDSAVSVTLQELDMDAPEALKSIVAIQMQTHRVDDGTSYGTVRVRADTGGDISVASAEIDHTFGSSTAAFTDWNIASSGNPGTNLKTAVWKLTLGSGSSTAKTPNALPVNVTMIGKFPFMRMWPFQLSKKQPGDTTIYKIIDKLRTLEATSPVQRLVCKSIGLDVPARFLPDYTLINYELAPEGNTVQNERVNSAVVYFVETPGATS